MNNESIILEMIQRIQKLENDVKELREILLDSKEEKENLQSNTFVLEKESIYAPITEYLNKCDSNLVEITFEELEEILGFNLNKSLRSYPAAWYGEPKKSPTHVWKQSWYNAGFYVKSVNLNEGKVTFASITKCTNKSKYAPFTEYLKNSEADRITMTFNEIEGILGFKLANSFRKYTAGWYGTSPNDIIAFKKSWHRAGFTVEEVSLYEEKVTFVRFDNPDTYKIYN